MQDTDLLVARGFAGVQTCAPYWYQISAVALKEHQTDQCRLHQNEP